VIAVLVALVVRRRKWTCVERRFFLLNVFKTRNQNPRFISV